jgi:hypothetical protein
VHTLGALVEDKLSRLHFNVVHLVCDCDCGRSRSGVKINK